MNSTGEFRVPSPDEVLEATTAATGERPNAVGVCSWCGKLEVEVKKLLGRGTASMCNECISLACDILDAEVGDWR